MKSIICGIVALSFGVAFAEGVAANEAKAHAGKKLTKAEMAQHMERIAKINGPVIAKPNSRKGLIRIVNSVSSVDNGKIDKVFAAFLRERSAYDLKTITGTAPTLATANKTREGYKADFAVFVIESEELPVLLTSPEERWAIVNSKKCGSADRTVKETLKAFACIAGAATGDNPGTILSTKGPAELDLITRPELSFDVLNRITRHLESYGVTPEKRANYRTACREGWAPQPTNDVEKAIWEKVHAIPTNPIKVKYDPKKGE